jgi:hypothetical protein
MPARCPNRRNPRPARRPRPYWEQPATYAARDARGHTATTTDLYNRTRCNKCVASIHTPSNTLTTVDTARVGLTEQHVDDLSMFAEDLAL